VTDDPLASAPASPPFGQRRRAVAPRPDLRLCLLEAIERRDAAQARLLGQRWVHRRGLMSLEAFQRITLRSLEGDGACRWLEEQLGLESPPASAVGESLPSVDSAFAALAAEFPAYESALPAEPAAVEELAPPAAAPLAAAPEEPLAPQPSFHPTASILAALAEPIVPAASPTGSRRWLPRLRFPAPARRPAPSPADLADLRAWLPDADDDDLPRAC
jgi:hypothetical protein